MTDFQINSRLRQLGNSTSPSSGPVLYWMTREQRVQDNWGLWYAQQQAIEQKQPLVVIFALRKDLTQVNGTARMLEFMLGGLREVEGKLARLNIPFVMWLGEPVDGVVEVAKNIHASQVVVDQFPLRIYQTWQNELINQLPISVTQVDGHNIVPVWVASNKQEYAARTIRPKITRLLPEYLVEIPMIKKHNWMLSPSCHAELFQLRRHSGLACPEASGDSESQNILQPRHPELDSGSQKIQDVLIVREDQKELQLSNSLNFNWQIDWQKVRKLVKVDESIKPTDFVPGETAAEEVLKDFITNRLEDYDSKRNDPAAAALSNLSPYLHFGQISAQRVALVVETSSASRQAKTVFLEELIIRRELADNYCYYNSNYDSLAGAPNWAQKTLVDHLSDPRDYTYTLEEYEQAHTHDLLWNAAQTELIKTGKMHGYLRMYWAKKILEWSSSPQQALEIAISLNDRYSLDGRDPNGYVGILWSIAGLHDRPWFKRPVFGSIRYMSASGCQKKFDVKSYIATWLNLGNFNYSSQSKSTSVSKSWLLFREQYIKPSPQKVYCYVDETGQDPRSFSFIVVAVLIVSANLIENLRHQLQKIEEKSEKSYKKWNKSARIERFAYTQLILSSLEEEVKVYFQSHKKPVNYLEATTTTVRQALLSANKFGTIKVSIVIDGLVRKQRHSVRSLLKSRTIFIEKVSGIRDESDEILRLADAMAGLIRSSREHDNSSVKFVNKLIKKKIIVEL